MPSLEWGTPTDMRFLRSVSVRDHTGSYAASSCEKRRSTSFDDTLADLANACASMRTDDTPEPAKKKANFWQSRIWKFPKGKKAGFQSKETLSVVSKKEESAVPKWKKVLHKLQSKARKPPTICASGLDVQVTNSDESGSIKGDGKSRNLSNQAERQQRFYSIHPEPIAASRSNTTTVPIWERRNVHQPSTLDLSNLRVTGLKHLQRPPHQQ